MEKRAQDINDAISQTAEDKRRAVQMRSSTSTADQGSCRATYLAACEQIATAFVPDGFRYAKSLQKLTRNVGEWRQAIQFQSSRNNVAGERIALWVHANVGNPRIGKWRKLNNPTCPNDGVGGGQLGNLLRPSRWFDWDLANVETRSQVIDEVINDLRQIALPYFDRFVDTDRLVSDLLREDIPLVRIEPAIDVLMCYRDRATAAAYVSEWLNRHPEFQREVASRLEEYRSTGIPHPRIYIDDLAAAIVTHKLDVQLA